MGANRPRVWYLTIGFVNVYLVGDPQGEWVLVDTGIPGTAAFTRAAVARRWSGHTRPRAIILTHGHFDHAGSARALAHAWEVPVYAGRLELPYLTGRSDYPPQDPTIGGAIAQMSRLFPTAGMDLGGRVYALPDDGSVRERRNGDGCTLRGTRPATCRSFAPPTACWSPATPSPRWTWKPGRRT